MLINFHFEILKIEAIDTGEIFIIPLAKDKKRTCQQKDYNNFVDFHNLQWFLNSDDSHLLLKLINRLQNPVILTTFHQSLVTTSRIGSQSFSEGWLVVNSCYSHLIQWIQFFPVWQKIQLIIN